MIPIKLLSIYLELRNAFTRNRSSAHTIQINFLLPLLVDAIHSKIFYLKTVMVYSFIE